MSRYLIGTIPVVGHVTPVAPIVRRLIERGHEVWWYTGKLFQPFVEGTGAKFVPMIHSLDYSLPQNVPDSWTERRKSLKGLAQLKFDLRHYFIDAAIGHVRDFQEVLREFPADVLLSDSFFLGADWVSQLNTIPWAQFGVTVLTTYSSDTAPFGLGLEPSTSIWSRLRNITLNWLFQNILLRDLLIHTNNVRAKLGLPANTIPSPS
jgi:UDP:flavonoid glycosyltransferase YjiC (YdhE family)